MNAASRPERPRRTRRRRLLLAVIGLLVAVVAASQLVPPWLFATPVIADDEQVVFFPTLASPSADGKSWDVSVHGWVFEPESGNGARQGLVATLQKLLGLDEEDERSHVLEHRVRRFLVDNERGKALAVTIGGHRLSVAPSQADGHFTAWVELPTAALERAATNGRAPIRAVTGDARDFAGEVHLVAAEGLSVISDIDDTVKVSEVTDKQALLRNTFLEPFRAVPGMAEVYRRWATERAARFHFVSSSPWQLYEDLAAFLREARFPPATFHLKTMRMKGAGILALFADPMATKIAAIEPLLQRFPRRSFVLVGDSGERDPEVYGELARRHPQQIRRVFVRNVTGEQADSDRFTAAFADIPRQKWLLFTDPAAMVLE